MLTLPSSSHSAKSAERAVHEGNACRADHAGNAVCAGRTGYGPLVSGDRLLTSAQAARELGISARTIQHYTALGKLTPDEITPGGRARWRLESLREQFRRLREGDETGPEG